VIAGGLSRRYAKAVFQLARENHSEEATGQELQQFTQMLDTTPLGWVLSNPAYDLGKRKNILLEIAKSLQLATLVTRLLLLLLERRRLEFLPAIVFRYAQLLNDSLGRVDARAISAAPLDPATLERLRARLQEVTGKSIVLRNETDPGLIGGLVVEIEGKTYDGSIRAHLEELTERIERAH
jgi:F-type H+-transporting ATPase subunit delta